MAVPKFDELFNPLLEAVHDLGGSASIAEIEDKVAENLKLSDKEINEIHRGNRTKVNYRLAWARYYLKKYGLLENSTRGIWSLTPKGVETKSVEKEVVTKQVNNRLQKSHPLSKSHTEEESPNEVTWQYELLEKLKNLSPAEFERLCQRILREAGFIQVTVTGKSGDGGIDGTGIVRIGGFLSFRVIFQCKRYSRSVSSQEIREFKGTMVGRADKGLFISTGTFTKDAKLEASRDGAPPIDLVDGEQLVEKMKELGLGVKIKLEERIEIDDEWLRNF